MKNDKKRLEKILTGFTIIAIVVVLLIIGSNLTSRSQNISKQELVIISDPNSKLSELSSDNFTMTLFVEALSFEPLLNETGTQVHMGFWSGRGNHGNLVKLLDDVNSYQNLPNESAQKAIWDEGPQSSLQYPQYFLINAREAWYQRATNLNGSVLVYGMRYIDPYNVTLKQADDIWGEYSKSYTEMARLIRNGTGKKVQVWCFVQGAKQNRVFYKYEYPELQKLEKEGIIEVHFAKKSDADWKNQDDWYYGLANITNSGIEGISKVFN